MRHVANEIMGCNAKHVSSDVSVCFKTFSVHVSIFLGYCRLISIPLWTPGDNQCAGLSQR